MPTVLADTLTKIWPQLGATGVLIVVLVSIIYYMNKHIERREVRHQEERCEWQKQIKEQADTMKGQTDKMIDVAQNCATALTEISTLIKSRGN